MLIMNQKDRMIVNEVVNVGEIRSVRPLG